MCRKMNKITVYLNREELNRADKLKELIKAKDETIEDLQEELDWMTYAYNQKDKLFDELKEAIYKVIKKEVVGSEVECNGKCKCKHLKEEK